MLARIPLRASRTLRHTTICTIPQIYQPYKIATMSTSTAPAAPTSTTEVQPRFSALFTELENRFKATKLGSDKWYILAISTLAASPDPERADQLYLHLTQQEQYTPSAARQALIRRLREALVKSVPIVGVCKPIEAILSIAEVERVKAGNVTRRTTSVARGGCKSCIRGIRLAR
jgi:hypothetical protein